MSDYSHVSLSKCVCMCEEEGTVMGNDLLQTPHLPLPNRRTVTDSRAIVQLGCHGN